MNLMDLIITSEDGQDHAVLLGAGALAAVRGAAYTPGGGAGKTVTEQITLALEGAPDDIRAALDTIGRLLERANRPGAGEFGQPYHLMASLRPGESWMSRILRADLEFAGGEPLTGSLGARITLARPNFWESAGWVDLPLTNRHGQRVTGPEAITVYNHADAAHDNFVTIAGADIPGELRAPVRLELFNPPGTPGEAVRSVAVGVRAGGQPPLPSHILEGEASIFGIQTDDAACSGGAYAANSWSGADEVTLFAWPLADAGRFGMAHYRAGLRLTAPLEYDDLWLRVRLLASDRVVYEGGWMQGAPGSCWQDAGVVRLPPYPAAGAGLLNRLEAQLRVRRAGGGGLHTLALDDLELTPLDGYRLFASLGAGLAAGECLSHDDRVGQTLTRAGGGQGFTHSAAGMPLRLWPGLDHRLSVRFDLQDGTAPPGRALALAAAVRPRRRVLA